MDHSFHNKVAIITGSGSGIGKATAVLFCKNGFKVMLNGRDEIKIKRVANELISKGHDVSFFTGDVTDYETCKEMVTHTINVFGKINVLVTNASISMNARFDEMRPELFKKVLDSNIFGAVMPLFASLDFLKHTRGSVVFIGSLAGLYGMPTASAYSAGKMALTALQQSLRAELHSSGVHVGILYVGFTENDNDKKLMSPSGVWKPVPKRPRLLLQTQDKVASSVLLMIKKRIDRRILSTSGKCISFLSRVAPGILGTLTIVSQKKK